MFPTRRHRGTAIPLGERRHEALNVGLVRSLMIRARRGSPSVFHVLNVRIRRITLGVPEPALQPAIGARQAILVWQAVAARRAYSAWEKDLASETASWAAVRAVTGVPDGRKRRLR